MSGQFCHFQQMSKTIIHHSNHSTKNLPANLNSLSFLLPHIIHQDVCSLQLQVILQLHFFPATSAAPLAKTPLLPGILHWCPNWAPCSHDGFLHPLYPFPPNSHWDLFKMCIRSWLPLAIYIVFFFSLTSCCTLGKIQTLCLDLDPSFWLYLIPLWLLHCFIGMRTLDLLYLNPISLQPWVTCTSCLSDHSALPYQFSHLIPYFYKSQLIYLFIVSYNLLSS